MNRRPNILLILTDQQRSTALGCAGVEDVHTPHLDRLGSQGCRFTNAVSNTPACSPARATIMTGRHVLAHGVVTNDIPLRTDLPHLAQALTAAGYRCGYIGKWHLDEADRGIFIPPGPRRRGFDDFWAVANCTHDYPNAHYYLNDDPEPYFHRGYEPFGQADDAIAFLRARASAAAAEPFCLFLSFGTPHCPYHTAPAEFHEPYRRRDFRLLPNVDPDTPVQTEHQKWGMAAPGSGLRDIVAGYYAHLSATDHACGRLLAAVDELGLGAGTIVVFTSDHGDMLFSHRHGWKCKPWRESAGVPLLVRWPGRVPSGRVSDAPVGLVDLLPTLLSLAGVPTPAGVEGRDLSRLWMGDESAAPPEQYVNFVCMPAAASIPEWRGVVTRTHTYVRTRQGPWLLFDDRADPFQMHNLVGDPAAADVRADLDARVGAWLRRTGDGFAPSRDVADRYAPGHARNQPRFFFNEKITAATRDPALRRYRSAASEPT